MKSCSRSVAAFALALVLILLSWPNGAETARLLLKKAQTSAMVSSQALKDLQEGRRDPFRKVESSFRRIPPSRSNPKQNKSKPQDKQFLTPNQFKTFRHLLR
ncbi:uncharacterized protein LOC127795842 [Diospyros lotus]|uniref:uncharacterized protein LOC127795842 n=1 Tax=Diospyros lotus TaxID=55363 RepID=UPI0022580BDD|nr:uncharacterized protein LOC127795842 [Diospyros lotus]